MPKYIFADGKVRVEEDAFSPLLSTKPQFTELVVFLMLREMTIKQNVESAKGEEDLDVHQDP